MSNKKKEISYINTKVDYTWTILRSYKSLVKMKNILQQKLMDLDNELMDAGSPSSPRFDKNVFFQNHDEFSSIANEIIDRKDEVQKEMLDTMKKISNIQSIVYSIEDDEVRLIAIYLFIEGHTQYEAAEKFFQSRKNIELRIKKELGKVLQKKDAQ